MTAATGECTASAVSAFLWIALLIGIVGTQACTESAESGLESDLARLSETEQEVVLFLVDDWSRDLSSTSVDLAMDALGLDPSDEDLRYRIGSFIRTHPELHAAVRTWGWETIVLTPDEKLLGRALIDAARSGTETPSLNRLADQVDISGPAARAGLEMLTRYEILRPDPSVGGVGYMVASDRYLNWEPRVDFQFHSVYLSSGRQFNTN